MSSYTGHTQSRAQKKSMLAFQSGLRLLAVGLRDILWHTEAIPRQVRCHPAKTYQRPPWWPEGFDPPQSLLSLREVLLLREHGLAVLLSEQTPKHCKVEEVGSLREKVEHWSSAQFISLRGLGCDAAQGRP